MGVYIGKRLALTALIMLGVSVAAMLLVHLAPGDPARVQLGPHASVQSVRLLRHQLGLDRPLLGQYGHYMTGALHGDFGTSVILRTDVASVVGQRILPSLLLIGYSLLLALALSIPLAVLAARKRNRAADHAIRLLSTTTFAMPPFWLGLLLVLGLSIKLNILPTAGYGDTFPAHLASLTLPALTIALTVGAPVFLRTLRSSLVDTMTSEFVDAARSRGFSERRVLYRHVLRNSLTSMVTLVGVAAGALFSTTVVVENVFAIPGLGQLLVSSVTERDFAVIQTLVLLFGVAVVLLNLLTDLAYLVLDPRVRL